MLGESWADTEKYFKMMLNIRASGHIEGRVPINFDQRVGDGVIVA